MSSHEPVVVSDTNVSRAWAKILMHAIQQPGTEISPLIISVTGLNAQHRLEEAPSVRDALDQFLRQRGDFEVSTVANTIFPQSVWRICGGDRQLFYEEYINALPRYAAIEPMNRDGTYFSRLIAFDINPRTGTRIPHLTGTPENGNQLEYIIKLLENGAVRRDSAFQASIFDPTRDHSEQPYKVFPCMQHLTFIRSERGGLSVNAFYATQQIVRKAYGNLLGLCRLGQFIATQTGLELERVTVFVGCEKIGGIPKNDPNLAPVIAASKAALVPAGAQEGATKPSQVEEEN